MTFATGDRVLVTGVGHACTGVVRARFATKRWGIRHAVEDDHGFLQIHDEGQLVLLAKGGAEETMTLRDAESQARTQLARGWYIRLTMSSTGPTMTLHDPEGLEAEPWTAADEDDLEQRLRDLIRASHEED